MSVPAPEPRLSTESLQVLARQATPARLLVDRAGGSYLTATHLQLRADHAAAKDAVHKELELTDLGSKLVDEQRLFLVQTEAATKAEFLLRPDLGRKLSLAAKQAVGEKCSRPAGLQVVIGDGLSATAVRTQVPELLSRLMETARATGWAVGQPFVVRYCRVGVMNDVGDLLRPDVVVLLIGERPGLATAESLSAYMAFQPKTGQTDADRNLISNIHSRGVSHESAVVRILDLAAQMRDQQTSGVAIKERLPERAISVASANLEPG